MRVRWKTFLIATLLFSRQLAHAADQSAELRARLKAASELTALDASGLLPWHWKVDLTVFEADGKNAKTGTLEMWFSGTNMLTQYSIGAEQATLLRVGDKLYCSPGELKQLPKVILIQLQLVHPIPDGVFQPSTTQKLIKQKIGQRKLESIAPALVPNTTETVELGQPFSFLFDSAIPQFLAMVEPGGFQVVRQKVGVFQAHEVPTDLQEYIDKTLQAEAKTITLETFSPQDDTFEVKPELVPFVEPAEASSGTMAQLMLSETPAVYPTEAKSRHAAGNLAFDAIIGRDGRVKSLQPAGQFDASLLAAAKTAISGWIYRPFLINGIAVEVKTTIRMNFTFEGD